MKALSVKVSGWALMLACGAGALWFGQPPYATRLADGLMLAFSIAGFIVLLPPVFRAMHMVRR
jgi:hypothetical protein